MVPMNRIRTRVCLVLFYSFDRGKMREGKVMHVMYVLVFPWMHMCITISIFIRIRTTYIYMYTHTCYVKYVFMYTLIILYTYICVYITLFLRSFSTLSFLLLCSPLPISSDHLGTSGRYWLLGVYIPPPALPFDFISTKFWDSFTW
jgi:hypothetical protein